MITDATTSANRSLFVTEYYLTLELSSIFSLQAPLGVLCIDTPNYILNSGSTEQYFGISFVVIFVFTVP